MALPKIFINGNGRMGKIIEEWEKEK